MNATDRERRANIQRSGRSQEVVPQKLPRSLFFSSVGESFRRQARTCKSGQRRNCTAKKITREFVAAETGVGLSRSYLPVLLPACRRGHRSERLPNARRSVAPFPLRARNLLVSSLILFPLSRRLCARLVLSGSEKTWSSKEDQSGYVQGKTSQTEISTDGTDAATGLQEPTCVSA